jgi:DNA-binding beta-propeller fold protein YncE
VAVPTHPGGEVFGDFGQASDAVEIEGLLYVLDTNNSRILVLDGSGIVKHVMREPADGSYRLDGALGIATDGEFLYVANTDDGEVLILDMDGLLIRRIGLDAGAPGGQPRPVGLFVGPDGGLVVSDVQNHRVLFLDSGGDVVQAAGTGARAAGSEGFNAPGGVTSDLDGYTYVADMLNGRVVKLSPEGDIVRQFGRLGDTAGTLSRPKDVAVDEAGRVYVSDGLLAVIQVFAADGEYLGLIGRKDGGDAGSGSIFAAPAGLSVTGGKLYVIDRFAGLFVFDLPD